MGASGHRLRMRIATFNINDVNKRLPNLLAWLTQAEPDVVCLQELKARNERFPASTLDEAGYGAVWCGQSAWNGVAILARGVTPVLTRTELPGDTDDRQARYIEAAVGGILVASIYAPNGNPKPGPKFDYKLAWNARLIAHAAELWATGLPVILAGDYNIVPEPRDIYPTRSYDDNALVDPACRAQFAELLAQGWVDAVRRCRPNDTVYTFWHYMRNRWPRDAGLRLDHLLLSGPVAERLAEAWVDRDVRGAEGASDHAPVVVALSD